MYSVTRVIHFCYGHRLLNYPGKCRVPHGHNGKIEITLASKGLDRLGTYAESAGVDILIETHGDFSDSKLMHETLSQVKSRAVGVLWDTHHPWRFYNESLAETLQRLRPWVRRIAAREAIRHAKKGRRTTPMEGNHVPAVMPSPAEIGDVRAVLERLAPEQRAILVLRDLEGWSEEEAAAQLEIAIGTAKSRLSRARSAFKRRWR